MATTTVSAGKVCSEPSMGMGLLRPDESGAPSLILRHSIAFTHPRSSPMNLTGWASISNRTPSSSAFRTSSSRAGISSLDLLYKMTTSSAPSLRAHRAASIAEFPPPTTTTLLPTLMGVSYSGNL